MTLLGFLLFFASIVAMMGGSLWWGLAALAGIGLIAVGVSRPDDFERGMGCLLMLAIMGAILSALLP